MSVGCPGVPRLYKGENGFHNQFDIAWRVGTKGGSTEPPFVLLPRIYLFGNSNSSSIEHQMSFNCLPNNPSFKNPRARNRSLFLSENDVLP